MTAALFLDRDGVINVKAAEGEYVRTRDELRLLPGAAEALGFIARQAPALRVLVVTNQRGVARGLVDPVELDAIHALLRTRVADAGGRIDGIYVCPHERDSCDCRKPGTGLFLAAQSDDPTIDFPASAVVGDSLSDLVPGARLGCRTMLVADEARAAEIAGAAADAAIRIDATAPSLLALVERGELASLGVAGMAVR